MIVSAYFVIYINIRFEKIRICIYGGGKIYYDGK